MKNLFFFIIGNCLSLLGVVLFGINFLYAQPGQLVPCFTTGTGFNGNANSFVLLPTGKILCAGNFTLYNGSAANRICRLNADGALDPTFVGNIPNGQIYCMQVLSSGQILIAGSFTAAKNGMMRLNADGSVDAAFNMSGTGINGGYIQSFAVQSDGKIVVGGDALFTQYNGTPVNSFARLNADGSLDAAFNSGATSGINGSANNIKIQVDGKILLAGDFTGYKSAAVPKGLIRINPDGSRDVTFNNGGSGASNSVNSMALQPDGKIVVGLSGTYNGFVRNNIARINADGSLDNTFFPLGPNGSCNVAVQSDGKILVTGSFTTYDGFSRNNIARANSDGSIDISFNPGTGTNQASTIGYLLADGTVIIGGYGVGFVTYNGASATNIARIQLSAPVAISGTSPQRNSNTATLSTPLTLNFSQSMNAATASQSAFRIWGGQSGGLRGGTYSGGGTSSIGFTPTQPYKPGELVSATLLCGAQSSVGTPASPQVMQFRTAAGVGPARLFNTTNSGAGNNTLYIAAGNVKGTAAIDAIGSGGQVKVYEGDGTGNFATPSVHGTLTGNRRQVCVGDFNNDGVLDVACGILSAGVEIFINTGSGLPAMPNSTIAFGAHGLCVCTADFNGDGNLDIAAGDYFGGALRIGFGDGTGAFPVLGANLGLGTLELRSLKAGDVDNDGDIDILATFNAAMNNVRVLQNNGQGVFTVTQTLTIAGGMLVGDSDLGDIDGNGTLDAVVAHFGTGNFYVLRNTAGTGTFTIDPALSGPVNTNAAVFADMDGVLGLDIVHGGRIFKNDGSGNFTLFSSDGLLAMPDNGIAVADFDGDNDLDVVRSGNGTTPWTFWRNATQPLVTAFAPARNSSSVLPTSVTLSWSQPMTSATASLPTPASLPHSLYAWGSMTGYRTLPSGGSATQSGNTTTFTPTKPFRPGELVSLTVKDARATSLVQAKTVAYSFFSKAGNGSAKFVSELRSGVGSGSNQWGCVAADFNNDGKLDVLVNNYGTKELYRSFGNGNGTFQTPVLQTGITTDRFLATGDFNNDGYIDAVCPDIAGTVNVALNDGLGNLSLGTGLSTPTFDVCVADFNGDGNVDIATANYFGAQIFVSFGNGTGTSFTTPTGVSPIFPNAAASVRAADVDNDGDIDIIGLSNDSGSPDARVYVLYNDGQGTFTSAFYDIFLKSGGIAVADFNGDGWVDIAASYQNAMADVFFGVLFNNGSGTFAPITSLQVNPLCVGLDSMQPMDADGDGDMDVVSRDGYSGSGGYNLVLLKNNGSGTFSVELFGGTSGSEFIQLAPGDFDGDGDMDVLAANYNSNVLSYFINAIQPSITSFSPTPNAVSAPSASSVSLTFSQTVISATASANSLKIWGGFTGYKTGGTRSVAGSTVTANVGGFRPGEQVWVTSTTAQSTALVTARPFVYGFTAKAGVGPGTFIRKGSYATILQPFGIALGDVDNDGDIDMAVANQLGIGTVTIRLNDGSGDYTTEQPNSPFSVFPGVLAVCFGDVDNDGDLDLVHDS